MPALSVEVADGGVDGEYFVSISNITVTMYLTVASRGVNIICDLHRSLNVSQLDIIQPLCVRLPPDVFTLLVPSNTVNATCRLEIRYHIYKVCSSLHVLVFQLEIYCLCNWLAKDIHICPLCILEGTYWQCMADNL